MRLRHIEVFHAVFTSGSVTAAARLLGVSQPSISKVLSHAEQQLGYRLFERVRGKMVPTHEAEQLIGLVSVIYKGIDELQHVARNLAGRDDHRIRTACTPAFGIRMLPAAVARLLAEMPDTEVELETLHFHQLVRALNQSRIDIGLAFQPPPLPELRCEVLAQGRFMVAVNRSFAATRWNRSVPLRLLEDMPFIGMSSRGPLGQVLREQVVDFDTRFKPRVQVETYQSVLALVSRGAGVALIDEITARSISMPDVQVLELEPSITFDVAAISLARSELQRPAQRLVELLREELGNLLGSPVNAAA